VTDGQYIGSSADVDARWQEHISQLRAGVHENAKLSRAWREYGESSFEFVLLEAVPDRSSLLQREQYWLEKCEAVARGYNIHPTATGGPKGCDPEPLERVGRENKLPIMIRIDKHLLVQIDKVAREHGVSRSAFICMAMSERVEQRFRKPR
jgi:group I intron endonuclease